MFYSWVVTQFGLLQPPIWILVSKNRPQLDPILDLVLEPKLVLEPELEFLKTIFLLGKKIGTEGQPEVNWQLTTGSGLGHTGPGLISRTRTGPRVPNFL
jgi:hypothetical protein